MKPGIKSSEFWLSLVALVVAFVLSSGLLDNALLLSGLGALSAALTAAGYSWSRGKVKGSDAVAGAYRDRPGVPLAEKPSD